jgi:hypothetical protein
MIILIWFIDLMKLNECEIKYEYNVYLYKKPHLLFVVKSA